MSSREAEAHDTQFEQLTYEPPEIDHAYGEDVHILNDPLGLTRLADLCSPEVDQPEFNRIIEELYGRMLGEVVNAELPRRDVEIPSRMQESTERAVYAGQAIDPTTEVVTVDIARAGIIPSHVCFRRLTELMDPAGIRQDHITMSRVTNEDDEVVGVDVDGEKIGGGVDGRVVLFPDPMGATGTSMSHALDYYKQELEGRAAKSITMNLIITPEFIRRIKDEHPDAILYALRLDRGMSDPEILQTRPGERWDEESGLDEHQYIVPGGGGFGELMNNSYC